ncbi:hypothetical protein MHM93_07315 [Pseudoalteromonas sp. MM17-2]|uniref:hypothetical protein n=1 Tax=Pseudoalteromonas sp. MM17-2 TaxID=2917753 RepID=UPI001EF5B5A5|nr:hypothetical protein [Pseudoalteromonas sp. MM17-2]MCG7543987.1 hypothetical protein [Pseudoalteromonas sp. MM17-2]
MTTFSKYELQDIAKKGASIILDASKFSKYDLQDIVKYIDPKATIELLNASKFSKYDLQDIASKAKAPGVVILRLS